MLGLLAPLGGALYDRFGARVVTASGMVVLHCRPRRAPCLSFDGAAANMPMVMLALAIFGVGPGLFISPNSGLDYGHRAGGTDRRGGQPAEHGALPRHERRHC
jgi:hypothetical protein